MRRRGRDGWRLAAGCGCVALAALLGGCAWLDAWLPLEEHAPVQAVRPAEPAELRLTDAALRAERALTGLQRIRAAQSPELAGEIPRIVEPELLERVSLDWIGPLDTLLENLAEKAGYGFVVAGPRPVVPLVVSVSVDDEALIFVLRDVGLQAGSGVLVVVDAERREVRVDWRHGWEAS